MNDHEKILTHYGFPNQLDKLVEELNELITEVINIEHTPESYDLIRSEIADVKNLIEQLEPTFDSLAFGECKTVKQWQEFKLKRTIERMK